MCFVILKIKHRQHELTLTLVPYPGYFGSEIKLIMNCQSIKNKKAEIHTVIESAKPDIILGNESWLTPDIRNSEIFPESGKTELVTRMVVFLLPLGVIFSVLKLRNWTPSAK